MVDCSQCLIFIMVLLPKRSNLAYVRDRVAPKSSLWPEDATRGELLSCLSEENRLLSNLYFDYFRSSGSCRHEDGSVIRSFSANKISEAGQKIIVDEFCKRKAGDCSDLRDRDGRLFGVGKAIINHFRNKVHKVVSFFTGRPTYYAPQPAQYVAAAPSPNFWSIFEPLRTPPPQLASPPASPPAQLSPFSLAALLPPLIRYQPYAAQNQPTTRPPSPYNLPAFDDPCYSTNCRNQNRWQNSSPNISGSRKGIDTSLEADAFCSNYGDVAFPLVGKSALDNSTVTILQDFPNLLQPVFFRKCRTTYPAFAKGKCIQEFLPLSLFINSSHSTADSLLPQEFVLVESGCRVQVEDSDY